MAAPLRTWLLKRTKKADFLKLMISKGFLEFQLMTKAAVEICFLTRYSGNVRQDQKMVPHISGLCECLYALKVINIFIKVFLFEQTDTS